MYQTSQHYRIEGLRRTLNQTISYLRGVSLSDSRSSFFQFGKAATYFKYRQDLHVCLTIFCQNAAAVYGFAVYGQRYVVLLLKLEYLVIYYCQYRTHCQKSTHLRRVHTCEEYTLLLVLPEEYTHKHFLNLVTSNQICIVVTLFSRISHQTEFRLMLNQSEKCNCNQDFVQINKIQNIILCMYMSCSI